ncbi:hypothetical protein D9M70_523580 [compost metagenome]
MGETAEVRDAIDRAPRAVTIGHQHALIAGEKRLRIFLSAPRLVVEQYHPLFAVFGTAIDPHVRFTLRGLAFFLQDLHRRFVAVDERLGQQRAA